jgi:hypothetical protein
VSTDMDIAGDSGNDLLYDVSLFYNPNNLSTPPPLNLGTITSVTAYLKQSAVAPDTTAKTYTIGSGLTIVSSPGGTLTWLIPRADIGLNRWYRFDVLDGSAHLSTALKGRLNIQDV